MFQTSQSGTKCVRETELSESHLTKPSGMPGPFSLLHFPALDISRRVVLDDFTATSTTVECSGVRAV